MNIVGALGLGVCALTGSLSDKDPFIQNINAKVLEIIDHSDTVPGLKSEEFALLKKGLGEHWNTLVHKGVLEIRGTDAEIRPYFVTLQAIVEHVLSHEIGISVQSLTGIIHTPMPATPLCTKGDVSSELVDLSIQEDPLRLFTVKARTTILRDFLFQGGDLYVVYPGKGLSARTEEQQQIYQSELENYPTHLFDCPMDCDSIENGLVGASYVFRNTEGKVFIFAIKMSQVNNPQDASFGLWFGEHRYGSPATDRVMDVLNTILNYSPRPIPLPL
ncbi:MAG TPA: hypothetical protein VGP47_06110 [Parachlamydiaceae bacterium]|nr:hypothetical protein [Parachlamydiaceae bacterium]